MAHLPTQSEKHKEFVKEPLNGKPVTAVPGIGLTLGPRLISAGIPNAEALLGQFLIMGRAQTSFCSWLSQTTSANAQRQLECFNALKEWCGHFLGY